MSSSRISSPRVDTSTVSTASRRAERRSPTLAVWRLARSDPRVASRMVLAAYSFVWIAFLAYVLSLVKRVRKVEADLVALEQQRR